MLVHMCACARGGGGLGVEGRGGSLSTFPIVKERKPDSPTNSTPCPSSVSTLKYSFNSYVPDHELAGQHYKTGVVSPSHPTSGKGENESGWH